MGNLFTVRCRWRVNGKSKDGTVQRERGNRDFSGEQGDDGDPYPCGIRRKPGGSLVELRADAHDPDHSPRQSIDAPERDIGSADLGQDGAESLACRWELEADVDQQRDGHKKAGKNDRRGKKGLGNRSHGNKLGVFHQL